jgi:hypothetical protein
MLFPEPYIDAALDTLRRELPGAILRQNQWYSDFEIPTPDAEAGYAWGVGTAFAPPMVEVGAPDEQLSDFSIGQHDATAIVAMIVRGWLAVDESVNEPEKLARALYRFGRCLSDVLLAPDAFGMHVPVQTLRASYRLNPETRESEPLVGSALLAFQLEGYEGRS